MDLQNTELETSEFSNEYDESFTDEEKVMHLMKLTSDAYTRSFQTINVKDIGFTQPVKESRDKTVHGLSKSVKNFGVLEPIHVMVADDDSEYEYILLTGLRRVYATLRNNLETIDAIVWDFKDKDQGLDLALYLGLMLNATQKRKWSELWNLYQILELQSSITPSTLEYLLQLDSGDAMRLKDVMLCDYDDIKADLLNDKISLDKAYKTLTKYRKEEDLLEKEDIEGVAQGFDGADEISSNEDTNKKPELSDEDVRSLLDMANEQLDNLEDLEDTDFDTLNSGEDVQQKVGDRQPLDPALKEAILNRDEFKCACCGFGGAAAKGILAIHHKIPVHSGGKDSMDNLVTLCVNHHILLHNAERNGGKLFMTKEDFEKYKPEEQEALKKTLVLAKLAVEADKRKHLSLDDVKKATSDSIKHPMPGNKVH